MQFTLLTITFNAERYLAQTLESAVIQRGVSFEHLLWDGGSTDKTLSIARSFDHVRVIEGKDNGIADAMNKIAEHAKGKYLLFLHADDLLVHAEVLRLIDRALQLHPQFEWAYGRAHIIDKDGCHLRTTSYEHFTHKRLRKYNFITHPATVVSKSLFDRVGGFCPELHYCMDYDLWLRLANIARPLALSTPIACFREHDGSVSTSEPLSVAHEAYLVRNRHVLSVYERFRSYRTWKKRCRIQVT